MLVCNAFHTCLLFECFFPMLGAGKETQTNLVASGLEEEEEEEKEEEEEEEEEEEDLFPVKKGGGKMNPPFCLTTEGRGTF